MKNLSSESLSLKSLRSKEGERRVDNNQYSNRCARGDRPVIGPEVRGSFFSVRVEKEVVGKAFP